MQNSLVAVKTDDTHDELIQLVSLNLDQEEYGVDVLKVREIIRMPIITRVPNTPHYVEGVINLRGIVVPVIDLRGRFGLPESTTTENSRIIVVAAADMEVGFIVDSANDVVDIDTDTIDLPPEIVADAPSRELPRPPPMVP